MSEGSVRQGCAVIAQPFIGAAWQRFSLVPTGHNPVDAASPSSSARCGAPDPIALTNTASAAPSTSDGVAGATAPNPLPLETTSATPSLLKTYQLSLPPNSTPALQRLRSLLEISRNECNCISPAQRVAITCEASALQSQVPPEYHPQFLELFRLLAANSRIQAKSPRPPYFLCNAAAPTPAVTPLNEFFSDLQVPGLSTYNVIATNIACVRMPPSALIHMHPEVQALAGHFHPAMTDVFFVVVDGRVLQDNITAQRPINVIAHRWAHDTLRHGGHAATRVKMIIKSPCGVLPSNHQEFSVPFTMQELYAKDLDVYSHENVHGPVPAVSQTEGPAVPAYVVERVALYSPNNCWFHIVPGSPFVFFTVCVFAGRRACICTMLVLIDFEDVFCKHVITALRNTPSLPSLHHLVHEFQEALDAVQGSFNSLEARVHEVLAASSPADSSQQPALNARTIGRYNLLKLLPANVRQRVFFHAWVVKGHPENVSPDFGRLSYFCLNHLPAEQHCSTAQSLQCIQLAANDLVQGLNALVSQLRSVHPLPLDLSHHHLGAAQTLFAVARRLLENPQPPLRTLLHDLDQSHLNEISHHTWRHMGHVQGDRVGEAEFLSESGSPMVKFYALVDTAMQCVYVAEYECSRSDGAEQRSNQRLMASGQAVEPVVTEYPPSSAAGQATSSAIPQSQESDGHAVHTRSVANAALTAVAAPLADIHVVDAVDAAVQSSDVPVSRIK